MKNIYFKKQTADNAVFIFWGIIGVVFDINNFLEDNSMDRRKFFQILAAGSAAVWLNGCLEIVSAEPDVVLSGNVQKDAIKISKLYPELKIITENPGTSLRIGLMNQDGEVDVLSISCIQEVGGERHIALTKEVTGEKAVLYLGWKGIFPSVRFAGSDGETLIDADGHEMEYAMWHLGDKAPALAVDWFKLGISAAAIGLAVFLGAKIIGLIIAAIAFVAYYAMILALVVAAIALLSRGAKWLLDATGWNMESVQDFFGKQVEEIRLLIEGAKPF